MFRVLFVLESHSHELLTRYLKDKFDVLVIPGGAKGAETISKNPAVQTLIREYLSKEKLVGMICAGGFSRNCINQTFRMQLRGNRKHGCTYGWPT